MFFNLRITLLLVGLVALIAAGLYLYYKGGEDRENNLKAKALVEFQERLERDKKIEENFKYCSIDDIIDGLCEDDKGFIQSITCSFTKRGC